MSTRRSLSPRHVASRSPLRRLSLGVQPVVSAPTGSPSPSTRPSSYGSAVPSNAVFRQTGGSPVRGSSVPGSPLQTPPLRGLISSATLVVPGGMKSPPSPSQSSQTRRTFPQIRRDTGTPAYAAAMGVEGGSFVALATAWTSSRPAQSARVLSGSALPDRALTARRWRGEACYVGLASPGTNRLGSHVSASSASQPTVPLDSPWQSQPALTSPDTKRDNSRVARLVSFFSEDQSQPAMPSPNSSQKCQRASLPALPLSRGTEQCFAYQADLRIQPPPSSVKSAAQFRSSDVFAQHLDETAFNKATEQMKRLEELQVAARKPEFDILMAEPIVKVPMQMTQTEFIQTPHEQVPRSTSVFSTPEKTERKPVGIVVEAPRPEIDEKAIGASAATDQQHQQPPTVVLTESAEDSFVKSASDCIPADCIIMGQWRL